MVRCLAFSWLLFVGCFQHALPLWTHFAWKLGMHTAFGRRVGRWDCRKNMQRTAQKIKMQRNFYPATEEIWKWRLWCWSAWSQELIKWKQLRTMAWLRSDDAMSCWACLCLMLWVSACGIFFQWTTKEKANKESKKEATQMCQTKEASDPNMVFHLHQQLKIFMCQWQTNRNNNSKLRSREQKNDGGKTYVPETAKCSVVVNSERVWTTVDQEARH